MAEERLEILEEREIVLRDKAAREGITIPDEVISYIAEKYRLPQALKGALINVSAYAARRQQPVTLEIARLVLDGIRPTKNIPSVTQELEAVVASEPIREEGTALSDLYDEPLETDLTQLINPNDGPESAYFTDDAEAPSDLSSFAEEEPLILSEEALVQGTLFDDMQNGFLSEGTFGESPSEETAIDDLPSEVEEPPFVEPVDESFFDEPEVPETFEAEEESASEGEKPAVPERVNELVGSPRKSRVYFVPMRTRRKRSLIERVGMALNRAGLSEIIEGGDKVAVKVHFGEAGNTGFVSPIYVREVVRLIKELGGKPFLTDANTLYSGQRANAIDHLECALANGFSYTTVGAPIIIADGLNGHDGVDVPINGKNCETVRIGSAAAEADALVVISHVKGHGEAGFGGAIKNIGMGLGTRSAKQRMHSDVKPLVFSPNCTKCGRCVSWCPVQCISMGPKPEEKAYIDSEHCIGCGECVAACAYDAIKINWDSDPTSFQEKMVEHAQGVLNTKGDKVIYLSFLTNVTPECDCWKFSDAAIVPDIGVLASRDIVAIEQASLDMVKQAVGSDGSRGEGIDAGVDKFLEIHKVDATIAINYAEEVGLGTREYLTTEIG